MGKLNSKLNKEVFFKNFYLENYDNLYYYALKRIRNAEVSKDIVSEGFAYLWENFEKINQETIRQYLYRVVHNKCVDYHRHSIVERKYISSLLQIDEEENFSNLYDDEKRLKRIRKVAETFSKRTYTVFYKCFIEEKKYLEVAQELSITIDGVKKHVVKALKAFRDEFNK